MATEISRRRRVMPRPFCACGCGKRLPVGNATYVNRRHTNRHQRDIRKAAGSKGGSAGWQHTGKNRANYIARLRALVNRIVPEQASFTRAEVLLLVYRGRTYGYHTGSHAMSNRYRKQVAVLVREVASLRAELWRAEHLGRRKVA